MNQINSRNKKLGAFSLVILSSSVSLACGVDSPETRPSGTSATGGISGSEIPGRNPNEGGGGVGGQQGKDPSECPSGVSVVLSDYLSTQIALSDLRGVTQSESLISTGSTTSDGLAFALSGDVVLPTNAPVSDEVVLLDRFGTNVVTWVNPRTAEVVAQLPVGTGFESNPNDYLELDDSTAVISRWGQNVAAGAEAHDAGGDLLFVNLGDRSIDGSLVLPAPEGLPARPSELSLVGGQLFVTLDRIALDFSETGEAMLVGVNPETRDVVFEHALRGRKACGGATLSPDGSVFAVACTGALNAVGEVENIAQSAVLLFDATARPLRLLETYEASDLLGIAIQSSVTFVDDDTVLLKTQTPWGGNGNNELFSLELSSGETVTLLEASADEMGMGKGVVFGGLTCAPGCSDVCLMTDADEGVLQRIEVQEDGSLLLLDPIVVEDRVGLPPLGITKR